MIGKLSWLLDAKKDEMKIIKVDYLAWPKSSQPEDIKKIDENWDKIFKKEKKSANKVKEKC